MSVIPEQVHSSDQLPPGLWEALQRPGRNKPVSRLLSTFANGVADVVTSDPDQPGILTNKFDLLCPRIDCASIILKQGVAKWVESASVEMEPSDHPAHPLLSALPSPPDTTQLWLVTPSPMAFENIGFSRPIQPAEKRLKLLACAECDLGPLGWSEEGGTEFWLACARVGYRE